MKKIFLYTMLSCILFLAGGSHSVVGEELTFKVIVNADNQTTSLSSKEIAKLFLKKVKQWEQTKDPVLPIDQSEEMDIRYDFLQNILGKKQAAIKAYWQKQIFSGRDVPPPEKESDKEILQYVAANPGAIGYVSASADVKDYHVTVVDILE